MWCCDCVQVPQLQLHVVPLQSMAQRQLVLALHAKSPCASMVQGYNFSWLGYPQDTVPSSRDLLPGLVKPEDNNGGDGGDDVGGGGVSDEADTGAHSRADQKEQQQQVRQQ